MWPTLSLSCSFSQDAAWLSYMGSTGHLDSMWHREGWVGTLLFAVSLCLDCAITKIRDHDCFFSEHQSQAQGLLQGRC